MSQDLDMNGHDILNAANVRVAGGQTIQEALDAAVSAATTDAEAARDAAQVSETNAANSATTAASSATDAQGYATAASNSATAAAASASASAQSATESEASAVRAEAAAAAAGDMTGFGTAALRDIGTADDEIPLNSDLATGATTTVGTSATEDVQADIYATTGNVARRGIFGWGVTPTGLGNEFLHAATRDLDQWTTTGNYTFLPSTNTAVALFAGGVVQNLPPEAFPDTEWNVLVTSSNKIRVQQATNPSGNRWIRTRNDGTWGSWEKIVTQSNETVVTMDNHFTAGDLRITRTGNIVTIVGTSGHTLDGVRTQADTSTGLIPTWARPTTNERTNVYDIASGNPVSVTVFPSGLMRVFYGASVAVGKAVSITYAVD